MVIAVLHDLDQVCAHCEQVLLLAHEGVACGPTAEVLRAKHMFRACQTVKAWDTRSPCFPAA